MTGIVDNTGAPPFRVRFATAGDLHEVEAPTFDAAIDVILNALASDVQPMSVENASGAPCDLEAIRRAARARLQGFVATA